MPGARMAGEHDSEEMRMHTLYHSMAFCRKVAYVLAELGLEYESRYLDFAKQEQKSAEYTKYNPNGRIPTLVDHANGDFVIW